MEVSFLPTSMARPRALICLGQMLVFLMSSDCGSEAGDERSEKVRHFNSYHVRPMSPIDLLMLLIGHMTYTHLHNRSNGWIILGLTLMYGRLCCEVMNFTLFHT